MDSFKPMDISPSFRCLAVDTATSRSSVAGCAAGRVALREPEGLRAPSRVIWSLVEEVLDELALAPRDLDCVAFGAGPGSFTGVRVAATVAQALGAALSLPVFRASTLAVLAAGLIGRGTAARVAACLDARMGQVYLGVYAADPLHGVRAEFEDRLCDPGALADLPLAGCLAAGPGWALVREAAGALPQGLVGLDAQRLPSAADLAWLAERAHANGVLVTAKEALPVYLREAVAAPAAEGRA
ncbi:MAG: tRNA (adenosine(37)-N6)-threonylcarbamoyltransferase complex dimerization subunit type 1 TsaB [Chromatiales bacterium]|nr:tRNA (adenosine(37)-N6)-threonylcarbamoyltransferase complex dimerization subunit type 1 TsaB [Chromatiales bacterium]